MIVLDCELYRNYFLLSLLHLQTGSVKHYEMYEGHPLDDSFRKVMRENLTIGFNSRNYDIPIIVAAASGLNNAELKKLSDQIILEDKPGWSLGYSIPDRWDHIDIIELAIGQSSLKIYGGRLGAPKMQDLPIEPDATITPEQRADIAMASTAPCRSKNLIAAGFLNDEQSFVAFANSKGAFGYQRSTEMDYTCTVRTADGRGSGWVGDNVQDVATFSAGDDVRIAMRKAAASADAQALEPGKYTVILEPAAAAGLIGFMMNFFDARSADEGRSFLSKAGGGNKTGEQVYGPEVNFFTDPSYPNAAVYPWDDEGMARERMQIVENGKISNLNYSRYWAEKQGKTALAGPGNLIMTGGDKSTADLVRTTQRGILVTRTWYIRMVDPQTVLLTGLTRDGTFYIEDGQIKHQIGRAHV